MVIQIRNMFNLMLSKLGVLFNMYVIFTVITVLLNHILVIWLLDMFIINILVKNTSRRPDGKREPMALFNEAIGPQRPRGGWALEAQAP